MSTMSTMSCFLNVHFVYYLSNCNDADLDTFACSNYSMLEVVDLK